MWPNNYPASFRDIIKGKMQKKELSEKDISYLFPSCVPLRTEQLASVAWYMDKYNLKNFEANLLNGFCKVSVKFDAHYATFITKTPGDILRLKVMYSNLLYNHMELRRSSLNLSGNEEYKYTAYMTKTLHTCDDDRIVYDDVSNLESVLTDFCRLVIKKLYSAYPREV